jgi:glutamate-ammonia-ligase adenylyltransferase
MQPEALLKYVKRNCAAITAFFFALPGTAQEEFLREMLDTPDPKSTMGRLEDLFAGEASDTVTEILAVDGTRRRAFLAVVGGSRFLHSILRRDPAHIGDMFAREGYLVAKNRETMERELGALLDGVADRAALDRTLRSYKELEYLRLGCRDLADLCDVRSIMEELSALAGASINAALEFHWKRLTASHGAPPGLGDRMGFIVMGLGKISGGELNFSSDVDLIYLRGPDEGRTEGPNKISVTRFYESLARALSATLSDVTEDGFVFRVDLRLRPEGEKGELVPALAGAVRYYLQWGRTWERAALMKAVPIAGDPALGKVFLKALEPFVFRKHLDYSTLEDMREMKLRIRAQLRRKPGINIKLGQGGIREIEFFVQALQLINGGKIPAVRSPSTCRSLDLLSEAGLLDRETADRLLDSYLFFRKTEHRIQIDQQLQTHQLPRTREDQLELARRMGYRENALDAFLSDIEDRRRLVEELFSGLFFSSGEDVLEQCSSRTRALVSVIDDPEAAQALLEKYGFENPAESHTILVGLLVPSDMRVHTDRSRRLLEQLAPLLIDELLKVPEPGRTLVDLDRYVHSLHSVSGYFSTLLENPATARFLVKILGESRFFTDLLVRHPQAVDSLIGRWSSEHPRERESLESELSGRLHYAEDYEAELDIMRIFKHEEILRIGISYLNGEISSSTARWLVTELAEVCLSAAVEIAVREMGRRFGDCRFVGSLPFVILGLGKLGGSEMSYLSDLDVIFIYDAPSETIAGLSAHEWFSRLAGRIISVLSVPTAEGTVFQIDTRLRPSGQKGPLVSSLSSFREYHRTTSKIWEKQTLIKARPCTGPRQPADEVSKIVKECVIRTRVTDEDLAEIGRLRRRMEDELAMEDKRHVDLKTGHGGLVDVEFFVQANILKHVHDHPEVLRHNTLEALAALHKAGLVDRDAFLALDHGYRFLTNLEDRLRIMEHRSVDRMPLEGDKLRGLAKRLGYEEGSEDRFLRDYFEITGSIRAMYDSFFHAPGRDAGDSIN